MLKTLSKPLDASLFFVIFLVIFNYTLTNMAAPYLAGDLGASNDIATYTITFFALGNAFGLPLAKSVAARIGTVHLLVTSLVLFAFTSWLCSLQTNYPLFIAFRFLQGCSSGPLFPLVQRILYMLNPPEKRPQVVSIIVLISTVCPVLGACWGGWIAYDYHWNWFFTLNIPILLLLALGLGIKLKNIDVAFPKTPFDFVGYLFYCLGIAGLCFAITTGQEFDWQRSPLIVTSFVIGVLSFIFFILWALHHPFPILDLRLFKIPHFSFAMLNLGILFGAYFGMVLLLALWLSLYANYTPIWNGILIGHMAVAGLLLIVFLNKGLLKIDPRIPLTLAIVFIAISCFYTTLFAREINFGRIVISRILAGFGLAFFLAPLFRLSFEKLPLDRLSDGVILFQVVRALSSGLGAAIYTTIWYRRRVFYHDRLCSNLTAFSPQTKEYYDKAGQVHIVGQHADAKLESLLDQQSSILALDDTFYLMGWVVLALLVVLILTYIFQKTFASISPKALSIPEDA